MSDLQAKISQHPQAGRTGTELEEGFRRIDFATKTASDLVEFSQVKAMNWAGLRMDSQLSIRKGVFIFRRRFVSQSFT